ncbi:ABC transporter substrate-binding protein [Candidatus Poribacteria bacterium]|nr:ABC transporter substrate-binding protein [Candidatus Poribacteria bacterium]
MKNLIFIAIILGLSVLFLTGSSAQEAKIAGDANGDGVVNILDLVLVASRLAESTNLTGETNPDVNDDGTVNILDLVFIANIMGGSEAAVTRTGGTLIFGRGGDSLTLDPAEAIDGESGKVCDMLYDTLVQYREATTNLEPGLAETWQRSADGLIWTFQLRQGVQFHDGTPFDADAVVFSLTRPLALFPTFHEQFIDQIIALDPFTVQIQLKTPYAPFISTLAGTAFSIVSPIAVQSFGEDFGNNPVGTGPFKFVHWVRDDTITLAANSQHWAGSPALDRLIFRSIPNNSERFDELQQGNIHVMDLPNPDVIARLQGDPEFEILIQPSLNIGYLAMNMEKPPFDNLKVRLAINHAINKTEIVDRLYQGLGIPAKNPLPPTLWSYDDSIQDYAYDPELAKRLLAEAGYAEGFETTLWALPVPRPYIPDGMALAEAIQADLQIIGVEARIVTDDWGIYLDKTANGEHDMAMLGWIADVADPDNFLYTLLSIPSAEKPAYNISFYRNEELQHILERARTSTDQDIQEFANNPALRGIDRVGTHSTDRDVRTALYRQAQAIFHEDAPWVPLAHAQQLLVIDRRVKNIKLSPIGWKYIRRASLESE